MSGVAPWVRAMTEDVLGSSPVQVGKTYRHPEHGEVVIVSGQYWGEHGLSNFWCWREVATGLEHHGYAGNWPLVEPEVIDTEALLAEYAALQHQIDLARARQRSISQDLAEHGIGVAEP